MDGILSRFSSGSMLGVLLAVIGVLFALIILIFGYRFASDVVVLISLGIAFFLLIAGSILIFMGIKMDLKEPLPESFSEIEQAINQLNRNYAVLRKQTTQGFIIAVIFMFLGLVVILSGAFGEIFGLTSKGVNLSSVAGIILEFISGTGLYIYRVNFKRLNSTSDSLNATWKILTAFKKAETLPEPKKTDVKINLINELARLKRQ